MGKENLVFEKYLVSKGLKLTKPRKIILNTVFATHEHFNIDELYDQIRKKHKDVSRATIYRTIPLLVKSGLIKQSIRCLAKDHYEHTYGHNRHLHLICEKCGKIIEVESKEAESILNKLAKIHSFDIKEYNVGAKGLCRECRK